uniref:exodeoxyribonuclease III n=1 Tax=Pygocentrus nattereri TaxID=42514 RepID=A0AAR2IY00_PYGNA
MATAKTITFVTLNINGLKQKKFQEFQEVYNADVIFLQETHIGAGNEYSLDIEDKWKIYFTQYTSSQKGSAILLRNTLDFKIFSHEKDINGAYLVLKCKLQGQPYTLVSVYNHHKDMKTLDQLSKYLQRMASGMLVIGGDFNTVLNPFIDKETKFSPSKVTNNPAHNKLRHCIERFMKSLQLLDVWRRMNPVTRNYTFNKNNIMSRLDYFFIPEECMWRIKHCEISHLQRPDHQPLILMVNNVPVIPCKKDQEIQYISQLLQQKKEFGIVQADLSGNEDNPHLITEVDIVTAIESLQVSDTPRPDGISVTFYKELAQDLIPYLKVLYSRMLSGSFDFQKAHFCDSVQEPHIGQHFFNVDYLIIASILARRIGDHLESEPKRQKSDGFPSFWITFKTLSPRVKWSYIKNALEEQKRLNSAWCQDFIMLENLIRHTECSPESYKQLCQGCPLTPVLLTLILKSISSNLIGHLEQHRILVFRQSIIICVQVEDQDTIEATLMNLSNDLGMSDIVVRSRKNGFQYEFENWDVEFESDDEKQFTSGDEDGVENWSERDKSDGTYHESDHEDVSMRDVEDEFHEDDSVLRPTFHHRQTMYAVVTLTSEEVVVVAKNWLTEDRNQSYWPPYKSPENFKAALMKRSPPSSQWEKIDVTFNGEYGTYADAQKIQRELIGSKVQKEGLPFGAVPLKRRKLQPEKSSDSFLMPPVPSRPTLKAGSKRPAALPGSSSNGQQFQMVKGKNIPCILCSCSAFQNKL